MIWEQNSRVIVMLTRLVEIGCVSIPTLSFPIQYFRSFPSISIYSRKYSLATVHKLRY